MILIVADHSAGKLKKSTMEMVSAARAISPALPIGILVLGHHVEAVATEAAQLAPQVLIADRPELLQYDPEVWTTAVAQIANQGEAEYIFIAGNRAGREYSARIATRLNAALLEDIIALEAQNSAVIAERYTYLARITETVVAQIKPVVATFKPGVFPVASSNTELGEQFDVDLQLPTPRVRNRPKQRAFCASVARRRGHRRFRRSRSRKCGWFYSVCTGSRKSAQRSRRSYARHC
jgi:electron transfer flavoprotein alpha subunit